MVDALMDFLRKTEQYVSQYPGSVREAFDFSRGAGIERLIRSCDPKLLRHREKGAYLFRIYQPLQFVYILLEGNCCVEKYKLSGAVVTDSTRHPLQMFGLFEGLSGVGYYTATIRCTTDCAYICVPLEEFLVRLRAEPQVMWMSLRFLSSFLADYIDSSDLLILNDPEALILSGIYSYCVGKTFPVTLPYKKEELARELNLNLRTLYRYLRRFYELDLLGRRKGKITVSQRQHRAIADHLQID